MAYPAHVPMGEPVYDEIEIEDMDYDEDEETYYYPCPCGDRFFITKVRLACTRNFSYNSMWVFTSVGRCGAGRRIS